ncbi:nitrate/nitrite transporter NarK [Saccharopolyspora lacisalsi]|uniref:Nitrate/nitrite transporter NarK n=1 Tax=Halosaccharopolyspora lacisalsi TaxID=1000566 RepID=A0A839DUA3_9PSEU|nr:MFS transporter [Halosaccharopolyspora lacisalsi]MBA8824500.1 nitrate/nitrite transporter NarK [Halosaccharopolyspora lacisalsi]
MRWAWCGHWCGSARSGTPPPPRVIRVSESELAHIEEHGRDGESAPPGRAKLNWADLRYLLGKRRLWGTYLGQFANTSAMFFFLTWFPSYLTRAKDVDLLNAGVYASIPYLVALVGVLLGGWWSDRMLRRGHSANVARKTPIIAGLLLATSIVAANYVDSIALVVAIMSVAFFAQGMAALGWALPAEIAPARMVGLTGGVFNFVGNIGGAVTPIVIGTIVSLSGSFEGGLAT